MKFIRLSELTQSFSFLERDQPSEVWAFSVDTHGIPGPVLETILLESQAWTGWGFNNGKAWLLFEQFEEAIIAMMKFGDISNVD